MVRFAPPRLAKLVTLALQARLHQEGHHAPPPSLAHRHLGAPEPPPTALSLLRTPALDDPGADDEASKLRASAEASLDAGMLSRKRPEEPRTPFERYLAKQWESNPEGTVELVEAEAKATWNKLGPAGRAPFVEQYLSEKAMYDLNLSRRFASSQARRNTYAGMVASALKDNPKMSVAQAAELSGSRWRKFINREKAIASMGMEGFVVSRSLGDGDENEAVGDDGVDLSPARTAALEALEEETAYYTKSSRQFASSEASRKAYTGMVANVLKDNPKMSVAQVAELSGSRWKKFINREKAIASMGMDGFVVSRSLGDGDENEAVGDDGVGLSPARMAAVEAPATKP